ncbi:RecX family transcriptional regulator [Caldalkalibacillus salinus]|uniref:RecX family transcriptional regulator n=1 Tax=Caldalkalibacillus salinus TaxID=2803787 RepID=UPI001922EEDD
MSKPTIISKIQKQKRHAQRYNIYIDDEYAFSVHEDVIVSHRLLKGREIDVDEMKGILKAEESKKAELSGLRYLGYRPRTTQEMNQYLLQKGYEQELIEALIDQWKKQGYLDDEKFAMQWVTERLRTKRKGPYVLQEELRQKGIATIYIERALAQIEEETQRTSCLALAEKKWRTLAQEKDERKRKQKLILYLQRRGYTYDIIQSILPNVIES